MPTHTLDLTTNCRCCILSTTTGHPGRWSDKTLVRFDDFATSMRSGRVLPTNTFALLCREGDGTIVDRKFSGVWLMCDNGYLDWSCMVPPLKHCRTYADKRWSKWLEGMRKDVECTFGILKGRFRVLKNGIRVRGPLATDNIWLTCCALHNFLLEEDGLDNPWDSPMAVEAWLEPEFADHSDTDLMRVFGIEEVCKGHRKLDATAIGQQAPPWSNASNQNLCDSPHERADEEAAPATTLGGGGHAGAIPLNSLSQKEFRKSLIEHFDVLFCQNKLKWPKRAGLGGEPVISLPKAWTAVAGTAGK